VNREEGGGIAGVGDIWEAGDIGRMKERDKTRHDIDAY